jgi:hypothetical protein
MSFDEQPDGDQHGECAAEIRRLTDENERLIKITMPGYDGSFGLCDMSIICDWDKN